jgi:hypothetical protein
VSASARLIELLHRTERVSWCSGKRQERAKRRTGRRLRVHEDSSRFLDAARGRRSSLLLERLDELDLGLRAQESRVDGSPLRRL